MAIAAKASVTTEAAVLDRLIHFEVDDLFGQYSYKIPVNIAKRVTAIIAPNGSGKTICLRMIAALFAKQWSFFSDLEFGSARYIFESGKQVFVRRERAADERDPAVRLNFVVTILIPDHKPIQWRPGAGDVKTLRASSLESYLHFLTRRGPNLYVHDYSGERYSFYEAVEAFSNQLPPSFRQQIYGEEPAALRSLIRNTDCHLIETQRLLILKEESNDPYRERAQRSSLAISKKAQTLREIVARELAGYATLSQSLDRTFPKRVIELGQRSVLAPEDLKAKLAGLENKRASLMEAGILDSEADTPVTLPEGQLEDAISRVLSVYAGDTISKLNFLSKLQARIELFIELISQRFSTKSVIVSKESGFSITSNGAKVPLDKLSSGEQHQLVLFFELLFELKENALILIDEPELSLHVAWQKKFIADLNRIIALNQFDVILATHSPPLVSRWTDLVVELGKVDDE